MSRAERIHTAQGLYQVTLCASAGHTLIADEDDRVELERLMANASRDGNVRIHAFCWLERELHLAIQVSDLPLGRFVQRIASAYAHHRQRRSQLDGHLFAHRYRAVLMRGAAALKDLVREIHRLPVREGRAASAADYRWSSHRAYLGEVRVPWLTTTLLRRFGRHRSVARRAFNQFVNTDGTRDATHARSVAEAKSAEAPAIALNQAVPFQSLDQLITAVCRTHGIEREQLTSRVRHPKATRARALIAWYATRAGLATLRQVAEVLHRHPSTLTLAIDRHRASSPHLFRYPTPPR